MENLQPFHLAIPVNNLDKAREFYKETLGCEEGRSSDKWIDFNFDGHQVVVHLDPDHVGHNVAKEVDGHAVPIPHFGIVLTWENWHILADNMSAASIEFVIEPYIRFKGEPGEQATMFFLDPSGNALEFKSFKDIGQLFTS